MTKATYRKIISLITYTLILIAALINFNTIISFIGRTVIVLKPLWIGILLAIILNVPMSMFESKIFGTSNKKIRVITIIMSLLIVLLFITGLFVWVIPDLIDSVSGLLKGLPKYVNDVTHFLNNIFKNTELGEYLNLSNGANTTKFLSSIFKSIINNFSNILSNSAGVLINLVTGLIIAIYLLFDKEKIIKNIKKIIDKTCDEDLSKKINRVGSLTNKAFNDFFAYQCLECVILGCLMFVAFKIFGFPYSTTIAFLTAVTAVIPIFGATIACIVGALLIATQSFPEAIIFVIVFQVIQQLENNLIYPNVVGKHVGLPPIITILAITVGAKIGGVIGMLICIPITSVIYTLFWDLMDKDIPKISIKNQSKKIM